MNSSEEHMDLIERYQSGRASDDDAAKLDALMLTDPQLRADFLAYARVDAALPGAVGGTPKLNTFESGSTSSSPARNRRPRWVSLAAAAVLILGWVAGNALWNPNETSGSPQEVAAFGALHDCRWIDPENQSQTGDTVQIGQRIELSSGSAELNFHTGARLEIVGPAVLEIRSENGGFLTMGEVHLVAETPESKGFTIETPTSKFIDISTAFTAVVSPDGLSRVDVTEGEVDVVLAGQDDPRRLRTGETMYVEPGEKKVITRIEAGDGTPAFRFPTIAPPSRDDYADHTSGNATIRVVHGELKNTPGRSGPISILLDGKGQSRQDSPTESAFFNGGPGGRILIDLGREISISRINSYSWHQHWQIEEHRERARQCFTLYGFTGEQLPDLDLPPRKAGWKRIARVNSDKFFRVNESLDRPAQQACSITADGGEMGHFRYLLWEVKPHTFYGEFDIFGTP